MTAAIQVDIEQGTPEWLQLRKTKITATDAVVIMNASPWKSKMQLYKEKTSDSAPFPPNDRMLRGIELEPFARDLYSIKKGVPVHPKVMVKDFAMASLDGISECGNFVVEIKCPGEKDHSLALCGKVPDHYYPQLQHQMFICSVDKMDYFSFDGSDGVMVQVNRDDFYIEKMLEEEKKFYKCILENIEPEMDKDFYLQKEDITWQQCVNTWKGISDTIKTLEEEEQRLRKQLIFLSGGNNCRGSGVTLCKIEKKGHVDYSKIPELKGVDLDKYRKPSNDSWRISRE